MSPLGVRMRSTLVRLLFGAPWEDSVKICSDAFDYCSTVVRRALGGLDDRTNDDADRDAAESVEQQRLLSDSSVGIPDSSVGMPDDSVGIPDSSVGMPAHS